MYSSVRSNLRKEAISAINRLPEEKLATLIQFAKFLDNTSEISSENVVTKMDLTDKRKSISGILQGKVWISEDFNDTPDCFEEYM